MRRINASAYSAPLFLSIFLLAGASVQAQSAPSAGTTVTVKMVDAIDSSSDSPGKQYRASVTRAVTASNGVAIRQGTAATVTLANSGSGYTALLSSITVNGQPIAVASGPATVTAAQGAASSAVNSVGSVVSGFGRRVSAPKALAAVSMGQRVVLPTGTTLTFVLSQSPASGQATAAAQPATAQPAAAGTMVASSGPAPNPGSSHPAVAAPGQHWWLCQYVDPKDPNKPVAGSRLYFAVFPANAAFSDDHGKHFTAYVQQNYKVTEIAGDPSGLYNGKAGGYCKRVSDDAAGRANSMDMFQKQWRTNNSESIEVNYAGTAAQDAAVDAKLTGAASVAATAAATPAAAAPTAAANQNYVWCRSTWVGTTGTKLPTGTVLYFSDVFAGTIPPPPSGATAGGKTGNGWSQQNASDTFQRPFFALLQKKYGFKNAGNYPVSCSANDPPTVAGFQNAQKQKQEFEDLTKQMNGQVVETGWSGQ